MTKNQLALSLIKNRLIVSIANLPLLANLSRLIGNVKSCPLISNYDWFAVHTNRVGDPFWHIKVMVKTRVGQGARALTASLPVCRVNHFYFNSSIDSQALSLHVVTI